MSHLGYAIWSGTGVNDTSSVVAASYAFSREAGGIAVIVKMARTTMLIPIALMTGLNTDIKSLLKAGRPSLILGGTVSYSLLCIGSKKKL